MIRGSVPPTRTNKAGCQLERHQKAEERGMMAYEHKESIEAGPE